MLIYRQSHPGMKVRKKRKCVPRRHRNTCRNKGILMWTVVYMSENKERVDEIISGLNDKSIMTMLKTSGEDDFNNGCSYEILVPQTELAAAQDLIFDMELL